MGRGQGSPLIVLDTHVWLWWCDAPQRLSRPARAEIERQDAVAVSAISCWELAMLERQNRLGFDRGALAWIRQALARERCVLLPITADIAIRGGGLHSHVPDLADGLIYATAVAHDVPLATRDGLLHDLDPARVIW